MTKVFMSWQSTNPTIRNKFKRVMKQACTSAGFELDEAVRGTAGAADIAATLLLKIEGTDVFVADLSLVGNPPAPNPNVLFETGYAAAILGWDRVLIFCDETSGKPEQLPFDIRHRVAVGKLGVPEWTGHLMDAAATTRGGLSHDQDLVNTFVSELHFKTRERQFLAEHPLGSLFGASVVEGLHGLASRWTYGDRFFRNKALESWRTSAAQLLVAFLHDLALYVTVDGDVARPPREPFPPGGSDWDYWEKELYRMNQLATDLAQKIDQIFELAIQHGFIVSFRK